MIISKYIFFSIILLSISPYNVFAISGSIPFNTGDVSYSIDGGNVESVLLDSDFFELIILMQTNNDGLLEITIPRSVLDAMFESNDDLFFVLVDGFETDYVETQTTTNVRTLAIPFFSGDTLIEIIGNTSNDSIPTSQTEIPSWIKQNAGWWHDDLISDSDFVLGIQYLIANGVMRV